MSILRDAQEPPVLAYDRHVPSVPAHIDQINPWILYHIKSTILSGVHHENQLYGSFNACLTSIFPLNRRFMIIPQAIIRRAMNVQEIEDDPDVSFGSTGAFHESRGLRKRHSLFPKSMLGLNHHPNWCGSI